MRLRPQTLTLLASVGAVPAGLPAQVAEPAHRAAVRLLADLPIPPALRPGLTRAVATTLAQNEVAPESSPGRYTVGGCRDTELSARLVDLNRDTIPELHVQALGTCVGGMAGTLNWVFVRAAGADAWRPNLTFNGFLQPLRSRKNGFADVIVGGPGFTIPVWRWNGREYALFCQSGTGRGNAPRCPAGLADTTAADSLPPFSR